MASCLDKTFVTKDWLSENSRQLAKTKSNNLDDDFPDYR